MLSVAFTSAVFALSGGVAVYVLLVAIMERRAVKARNFRVTTKL